MAAAGVLAAGALPALAASAGSDAKFLQLCRNYLRLAYGEASLKLDDSEIGPSKLRNHAAIMQDLISPNVHDKPGKRYQSSCPA